MEFWILHTLLFLLCPFSTFGHAIRNMCNGTGEFQSPVLYQNSSNHGSHVCSCTVNCKNGFWVLLKRFWVETKSKPNVEVKLTITNQTFSLDLVEINKDHGGPDCLIGLNGMIPCRNKWANLGNGDIVIQTLDNLSRKEYIYLQIVSSGNVTVKCNRIAKNDSYFVGEPNTTEFYENGTKDSGMSEPSLDNSHVSTMARNSSTNIQLDEIRKQSQRMMTASLVMLPIAGIVLIISLLILATAYRRNQRVHRVHSKRISGSTRRPPTKENPSYYEEVDEEFQIRMSRTAEVTDHGTAYDLATGSKPSCELPNSVYTEADQIRIPAPSTTDDGDYNVASHGQLRNPSPNIIDSTYDVAHQSPVVDLEESVAEQMRSPEVSTATCSVHNDVLQVIPSPDQGDGLYTLERTTTPNGQAVEEADTGDVDKEEEIEIKQENTSDSGDIMDAEIYANFSSLQSETETETSPKVVEEEDEEEIYINQNTIIDKPESPDIPKAGEKTRLKVPKPKGSGYINVPPAEVKARQSPGLASTEESDEEIYQNSPVGVESTVSLISTNSGSEEHYESYSTNQEPAPAIGLENENKNVEVVLLKSQGDKTDEGKKNYAQKQCQSLDDSSSRAKRRTGSKRRRPKSENTLLLDSSTSEEDALVMVNNFLYEGAMMASPKKKNCNHSEQQELRDNFQGSGIQQNDDDFNDDFNDDDDDLSVMVQNELYESFNCGGVSILPEEVSKEMTETLQKKNLSNPVNDSTNLLYEKM